MHTRLTLSVLAGVLLLSACASPMPAGPSVMVLPGQGKSFDQFRLDDMDCRNFAQGGLGGASTESVAADSGARSAVLGTALGAVAGAAANGGRGAAVGAGVGMATGGLAGVGAGNASSGSLQRRYDNGYQQCMYAKGHKIPGAYSMMSAPAVSHSSTSVAPPPPPPPPGPR